MAEILLEPSSLSKIIPLSFDLNDTNASNAAQLMTKRQFNTADTDAWFEVNLEGFVDTSGSFDITLFNLNDKSVFNHIGKPFTTSPFYYKLDSESDETTNEVRHAGRWIGQIVVTLANGNSATRKFIFDIEGHILDGADVQTILLEDYNALIATINTSKDLLAQYNVDYAALLVDLAAAETARTATYNQLVADQQANIDAFDVALDTGIVAANLANKLQDFETTNNSRLLSAEQQLAHTLNKSAITLTHMFADNTTRDAFFVTYPAELVDLQFIKVGTGYQQYIEGAWQASTAIVAEQLSATNQPIVDIGNYFSADNTNAALQELGAHKASTENPHGVTKTQVGLGSVDNTSDANKPVSTATQTALNLKANKVQEAWITPTLINGWVSFGGAEDGPAYYKDNFGNVKLRGVVKSGTLSVSIFDLPIGYRPAKNKYFVVISNNVPEFVLIAPSGGVIPHAGTSNVFVALDSISFKVD